MLRLGAAGDTRAELETVLGVGGGTPIVEAHHRPGDEDWRVATAAWVAGDIQIHPAFADRLRREFDSLIATVDFRDPPAARERINGWVAGATRGRITDLLNAQALTPLTRLVLTGAAWFKAGWTTPFPQAHTERRTFRHASGSEGTVNMMSQTGDFRLARCDGVQALTLPYQGGRASMLVVLPDAVDGLAAVEAGLDDARLEAWRDAAAPARVAVSLPRFQARSTLRLKETLEALGVRSVFGPAADLSGVADEPLMAGELHHQAFVSVDEEGVEAAAAAAVVAPRGPAAKPVTFNADHPFLYLIREREDGRILFMGRLSEPAPP